MENSFILPLVSSLPKWVMDLPLSEIVCLSLLLSHQVLAGSKMHSRCISQGLHKQIGSLASRFFHVGGWYFCRGRVQDKDFIFSLTLFLPRSTLTVYSLVLITYAWSLVSFVNALPTLNAQLEIWIHAHRGECLSSIIRGDRRWEACRSPSLSGEKGWQFFLFYLGELFGTIKYVVDPSYLFAFNKAVYSI